MEAALIGVHGTESGAPIEIRKIISFDIPAEITASFNELQSSVQKKTKDFKVPAALLLHTRRELASVEEEAICELLNEARLPKSDVSAAGINDPCLYIETPGGLFYQCLCDAAYLAEQTGLNIVDAFPEQDIAAHGRGGPLFPMPAWVFLKSNIQDRILLDLGQTARITFLPKAENAFSHQRIKHYDIIPCGSLLDALTAELTNGKTAFDIGGKLSVQGCRSEEIRSDLQLLSVPPENWNPCGLPPERYLKTVLRQSNSQLSCQDILCSAGYFISEKIAESVLGLIEEASADGSTEPEIVVSGNCRLHGLLMNSLSTQLEQRPMTVITQLGIPPETFDALCTAMLTVMAVSHIPSSLPHLTGSDTVKTLGRITPGSVANWQRLILEMSEIKPAARTLRSAA